jgi:hypothetical protein
MTSLVYTSSKKGVLLCYFRHAYNVLWSNLFPWTTPFTLALGGEKSLDAALGYGSLDSIPGIASLSIVRKFLLKCLLLTFSPIGRKLPYIYIYIYIYFFFLFQYWE